MVPTRKVRGKAKKAAAAAPSAGGAAAVDDVAEEDEEEAGGLNVDDLLPRADISGAITPALLGMISSSNWKERNAGVDQVGQAGWCWFRVEQRALHLGAGAAGVERSLLACRSPALRRPCSLQP